MKWLLLILLTGCGYETGTITKPIQLLQGSDFPAQVDQVEGFFSGSLERGWASGTQIAIRTEEEVMSACPVPVGYRAAGCTTSARTILISEAAPCRGSVAAHEFGHIGSYLSTRGWDRKHETFKTYFDKVNEFCE